MTSLPPKKGDSPHLPERPDGCFAQMGTVPFFRLAPLTAEMADLLESLCLEELSPTDAARLEELVRADPECCRQYLVFMQMHALAERLHVVPADIPPSPLIFHPSESAAPAPPLVRQLNYRTNLSLRYPIPAA